MFSQDAKSSSLPPRFINRVGILRKIHGRYVVESPIKKWSSIPGRMGMTRRTWLYWSPSTKVKKSQAEKNLGKFVSASGPLMRPVVGRIDPYNEWMNLYLLSVYGVIPAEYLTA
jgi:hypothetical protein